MSNNDHDHADETHLGWRHSEASGHEDADHLVIDSRFGDPKRAIEEPLVRFLDQHSEEENDQPDSDEPCFTAVDDQGVESPVLLWGAEEPTEHDAAQSVITFGEDPEERDEVVFS